jgi:4-alpha-glucanotransferase
MGRPGQGNLLRLIALESHRHRAVVIGEDLATVPDGLRERLSASGVLEHGLLRESPNQLSPASRVV